MVSFCHVGVNSHFCLFTPQIQIALLATDTWVVVSPMLGFIHLGANSHTGYSTLGANSTCLNCKCAWLAPVTSYAANKQQL